MDTAITVTLVYTETGQSESLPIQAAETSIQELLEWAAALFGCSVQQQQRMVLYKDGKPIPTSNKNLTLHQAGIQHGDVIAIVDSSSTSATTATATTTSATTNRSSSATTTTGGLDFSNLLSGMADSSNNNNTPATSAAMTTTSSSVPPPQPVYYPGMNIDEARHYNPHPIAIVTLLRQHDHLMKELQYYDPILASKLVSPQQQLSIEEAANIWRTETVNGGIEYAMRASSKLLERQTMQKRLDSNPNDVQALEYFAKMDQQKMIDEQYQHVMEEYPESFGRVLMLYIAATINGHPIQAFCDSGAQSTIMSKKLAVACQIDQYIDTRLKGIAVGVGTGIILGRIHMVQLQIGLYHFPCSVTVMDDPPPGSAAKEMPFLLGLDMMKRHTCLLDLERGCLRFRIGTTKSSNSGNDVVVGEYLDAPFLHEKDLSEEQGGTRGFDADKANEEFMAHQLRQQQRSDKTDGDAENDSKDDAMAEDT